MDRKNIFIVQDEKFQYRDKENNNKKDRPVRTCLKNIFFLLLLHAYHPFNFRSMLFDGVFHP